MILTQLIRSDLLARLSESQLQILNSAIEAEIAQNASIRRAITPIVQAGTKSFGGGRAAAASTKSTKKASK